MLNEMKIQGHLTTHAIYRLQKLTNLLLSPTDDITVAICPGIGNTSESVYIRTFVHYAQCHGYRTAVLNHIGALASVQVTSYRIFTYGMVPFRLVAFPNNNIFSMISLRTHWRLRCDGSQFGSQVSNYKRRSCWIQFGW